jgi:hypothetical protein
MAPAIQFEAKMTGNNHARMIGMREPLLAYGQAYQYLAHYPLKNLLYLSFNQPRGDCLDAAN